MKTLSQFIEETASPCGACLASRADERNDRGSWQMVILQNLHQATSAKVVGDVPLGADDDAVPGKRPGLHDLAIVAGEMGVDPNTQLIMEFLGPKAPERHVFIVLAQHDTRVGTEMRLAYVGMTRAEERFIWVAPERDGGAFDRAAAAARERRPRPRRA